MAFATTVFGQLLLGAFVMGVLLTWGVQLQDHAGYSTGSTAGGSDATGGGIEPEVRIRRGPVTAS